jgi:hypothetical protein
MHRISSGVATSILICSYVSDFTSIALLLLFVCSGGATPHEVFLCVMFVNCSSCFPQEEQDI